ncbi:MAG: long-chain fatty acid--CoA ligase [Acidobacteriaceae bacterium]|nr:long-chain fatty acid--CoA ligase [Acidobacteriaceae bacterium]
MSVDVKTINDAFLQVCGRGDKTLWLWYDANEDIEIAMPWKPITSSEAYGRTRALAARLIQWGVAKGDRVALLSENRWEWAVTDFATLALGAVDVPLYLTLTPQQIGYMLCDSGAKVAVVSSWEMVEKIRASGELPALEHIVVMDEIPPSHRNETDVVSFSSLMENAVAMQANDSSFNVRARAVKPQDLATIIYTSGTTGEPKGVMLTHGNMASNLCYSTRAFRFGKEELCISFLPLSHVTARHLDYVLMLEHVTLAHCPKFEHISVAMKQVRPTILVAVPRVYEKIRQAVEGKSHGMKKAILNWALGVGKKHRAETLAGVTPGAKANLKPWVRRCSTFATYCLFAYIVNILFHLRIPFNIGDLIFVAILLWATSFTWPFSRWGLANKLVFSKIRAAFGGRVELFVSGGAPLGMDTAGWFADVGIRIFEGYGLTETSPLIALDTPAKHRIGTVGPVLRNVHVRFAEDGELEVKGPSVFHGYWNKPQETAEAFTPDGWFRTGDIGNLTDGFLSITDRKKELLKTSGGKLIAPQPIENKLKARLLVGNAALVGDKHKFACVLISPNFAILESWAKVKGVVYPAGDRKALVAVPQVVARYQRIVDEINATLAPFESIKRVAVVPDEWTVETDELTPSMKLKRRVVENKYAAEIAEFYRDEATASR